MDGIRAPDAIHWSYVMDLHARLVVEDPQISVLPAHDRFRPDDLHLLRHHADIGPVATVITEPIKSKAIVEMTDQTDVVLERDIRSSAATATPATATTAASAAATTAAEAAPAAATHAHATAATPSSETGATT